MESGTSSTLITPNQIYINQSSGNNKKYINLSNELNRIDIGCPPLGPGLVGFNYYGNNYVNNSFVQKKYVDDKMPTPCHRNLHIEIYQWSNPMGSRINKTYIVMKKITLSVILLGFYLNNYYAQQVTVHIENSGIFYVEKNALTNVKGGIQIKGKFKKLGM